MAFGRSDVCEHGSLERKCDSCALAQADRRIEKLETALRKILTEDYEPVEDSFTRAAAQLAAEALST